MKSKKTIILINPPLFFSGGVPGSIDVSVPPLGLLYLASYINKHSHRYKAEIIDVAVEAMSLFKVGELLVDKNPFTVGITAMTPQLQGAVELARFIKENVSRKMTIFLGGPHISADRDFINRWAKIFDYAITGEAEKVFLESIIKLGRGLKIPRLQNGSAIENLDEIPYADRSLVKREIYERRESVMFSRGCPYNCYYCSRPAVDKKVRYRSVDNLMGEIEILSKKSRNIIDFQDDSFTLNREKVIGFCRRVVRRKMKIKWTCNTRIDLIDYELLKEMKRAGCKLIHFGVESGNERVRREIVNKGDFTNKKILEIFGFCKQVGIRIGGYFMIGHPDEIKRDLQDTEDLIFKSKIDLLGLSIPTPFPGSKLYEIAEKRGIINEQIIDQFAEKKLGEGYSGNFPVLISNKLTQDYVYSLMKKINRNFYLNLHTLWSNLKEDISSPKKLLVDARDMVSLFIRGVSTRKPYIKIKKKEKKA